MEQKEGVNMQTSIDNKSGTKEELLQFVTFSLNNEEYAVDILNVQEINRIAEITKVPNSPPYIEGVINLRGKVIPILNLRKKFGFPEKIPDNTSRIIIIETKDITCGMMVDFVSEVLRIPSSIIEPPPPISSTNNSRFIKGLAKLEKRLIILLNIEKIVEDTFKIE